MHPRILTLHDDQVLLKPLGNVCQRAGARLQLASSTGELLELLQSAEHAPGLVIAKQVGGDPLSVCAVLIASRASGLDTPFLVVADEGDSWIRRVVDVSHRAAVIDVREGPLLLLMLVRDWLQNRPSRDATSADPSRSYLGVRCAATAG